jgi:PilZ domain
MDRRRHERYELEAPVNFSWNDSGGFRRRHQGVLRNISGGGVFVLAEEAPPSGVRIRFKVPFHYSFAGSPLVIQASAQVVRVELAAAIGELAGFAVAIKNFTLRNRDKKLIERGSVGKKSKPVEKTLIKSETLNLFRR